MTSQRPHFPLVWICTLAGWLLGCAATPVAEEPTPAVPAAEVAPLVAENDKADEASASEGASADSSVEQAEQKQSASDQPTATKQAPQKNVAQARPKPEQPATNKADTTRPRTPPQQPAPEPSLSEETLKAKFIPKTSVQITESKNDTASTGRKSSIPTTSGIQPPPPKAEVLSLQPIAEAPIKPLQFNLLSLPITIADQWILEIKSNRCRLRHDTVEMEDGHGITQVRLVINQDKIEVLTRSNIDTEYAGTGLQVDDQAVIPIDELITPTAALFQSKHDKLIDQMSSGEVLTLTLGFWPTWPVTRTYSTEFDLHGFARAHQALQDCFAKL